MEKKEVKGKRGGEREKEKQEEKKYKGNVLSMP